MLVHAPQLGEAAEPARLELRGAVQFASTGGSRALADEVMPLALQESRPTGRRACDDPAGRPTAPADRGRVPRDRGDRARLQRARGRAVADVAEPDSGPQ